jgi:hypothetical protein
MAELTERQLLQETHDSIIELSAVVLGVKGQGGLVQEISDTKTEVRLAVTEMKLTTARGEKDVISLLDDIVEIRPRVANLENTIFGKEGKGGLCDTVSTHNEKIKTSSTGNKILWSIVGTVMTALLVLLVKHVIG